MAGRSPSPRVARSPQRPAPGRPPAPAPAPSPEPPAFTAFTEPPGPRESRPPVGLAELAPWYALGTGFAVLALLLTGAGLPASAGAGAGLLAAGGAAWRLAARNSHHTARKAT